MKEIITSELEKSHYYRGKMLSAFIALENELERYLATYFLGNRQESNLQKFDDFITSLVDRMTFESKRATIKGLFDKSAIRNGFIKTKSNSYPFKKEFDEIRQLIELRNSFAHYVTSIDVDDSENVIGLSNDRDNRNHIYYKQKDFDNLTDRVAKSIKFIREQRNKIQLTS